MNNKKVPAGVQVFTSQVKVETKSFVWLIKGINELKRHMTWRVPNCQFEAGGLDWELSLCPTGNGKYLHGVVTLVEPKTATAHYYLKFHVVNPQGHLILSSPFVCEHPVAACGDKSSENVQWEILEFKENPINQIEDLYFKDTLHILVEMTVFKDVKGNLN